MTIPTQPIANVVWYSWRIPNATLNFIHDSALALSIALPLGPLEDLCDAIMDSCVVGMEWCCNTRDRTFRAMFTVIEEDR